MYIRTICTNGAESRITIGESYRNLSRYLPVGSRVIIVTDANVLKHYGEFMRSYPVIETDLGEKHKTMKTLEHIYARLLEFDADRSCFIVAEIGRAHV